MPPYRRAPHRPALRCVAFATMLFLASVAFADNTAPNVPSAPRPFDGAMEQLISSSVQWEGGDPDGDGVTYDVYFGVGDDPPLAASGVTNLYYVPSLLEFITTYHWRIVARDQFGLESAGPLWTFVTKENTPPIPPFDPTPPNQSSTGPYVTLRWRSGDTDLQPITYRVHFGTSSSPPQVATGLTERFYEVGPLETNRLHYWRIVATDGQFSSSSFVWRFYVTPLPVEPSTWGKIKALYR